MKHQKPLYMTSRARSVQSNLTLRMSLVTPFRGFRHFPWINLYQLFICFVYEYHMVHFRITLFLNYFGNTFFYFQNILQIGVTEVRCWNASIKLLEFQLKHQKSNSWYTVQIMHIYFHTKWVFNKVKFLNNPYNTVYHPEQKHSFRKSGRFWRQGILLENRKIVSD